MTQAAIFGGAILVVVLALVIFGTPVLTVILAIFLIGMFRRFFFYGRR